MYIARARPAPALAPQFLSTLQAALNYDALKLQPFYAGVLVRFQNDFHTVADPVRCAQVQKRGDNKWAVI